MNRSPAVLLIPCLLLISIAAFAVSLQAEGQPATEAVLSLDFCSLRYEMDADTGRLVVEDLDQVLPGSPSITRTWRQGAVGRGLFGPGWHFVGESSLERVSGAIQVQTGDGRCLTLEPTEEEREDAGLPSADCLFSQELSLVRLTETKAVLEDGAGGMTWEFDLAPGALTGTLAAYSDARRGKVTVNTSSDGALLSITDEQDRRIDFQTNGEERCLFAIFQDGTVVAYDYDDAGRLCEVRTSRGDYKTYRYDEDGDLIAVECQGKVTSFHYTGAGSDKRCRAVVLEAPGGSGKVSVQKFSAAPNIVATPASLAFGKVAVGVKSPLTLKITNKGTAVLKVSKATLSGTQAADFKVVGFSAAALKPGKSLSLAVSFKPSASGSRKAALAIASNDPDTPGLKIPLSGTGTVPPKLLRINGPGAGDDSGKIGSVIHLTGRGFSSVAKENEVSFNTVATTATAVAKDPDDSSNQILTVKVPAGATSGSLTVRWLKNNPSPSNALAFTILPTASLVLNAGMEAGGIYNGAYLYTLGWDYTEPHHCWVLGGSGFSLVNPLTLVITFPSGETVYKKVFAFDNTRIFTDSLQRLFWDGQTMTHAPGEILTLKVLGGDKATGLRVESNEIQVPITDHYVPGATWSVEATFQWPKRIVSRGDFLVITGGGGSQQNLRSPGLWTGVLPVNGTSEWDYLTTPQGVYAKVLRLDKAGDFVITNETNGKSLTLTVKDEGVASDAYWDTDVCLDGTLAAERGAVLGFGGGRVVIPPGALPVHDGSSFYQICGRHRTSANVSFDTALTDGGHTFKVHFSDFPEELLQPITLSLPYSPGAGVADPELGIFNSDTGIFVTFVSQVDKERNRANCVIPAGRYAPPETSGPAPQAAMGGQPRQYQNWGMFGLYLNTLLESVSPVFYQAASESYYDFGRGLYLDVIIDPANPNFATQELADQVWASMIETYDYLLDQGWRVPWYLLHWSIRDLGAFQCNAGIGTGGATTAGVWGQPWTYINSNLAACPQTTVRHTVAHELGHSFERQYTTNIAAYWIDEATSEWVSFAVNGVTPELQTDITQGANFAAMRLPAAFLGGYSEPQAYAAGALAIWVERNYPGFLLNLYRTADETPDVLNDTYGQLTGWTTLAIRDLVDTFARDYWTQYYEPVRGANLNDSRLLLNDWTGAATGPPTLGTAPYSSMRYSCGPTVSFRPNLEGKDLVARATNFNDYRQYIYVYRDTTLYSQPVGQIQLVGTLDVDNPSISLGTVGATYQSWRFIYVNLDDTRYHTAQLRVISPRIESLSPSSGLPGGGYPVTITGVGFGDAAGKYGRVLVGGVEATVGSFSDTSVTFTMPNMGAATGGWNVLLYTGEDARSNYGTFTFINSTGRRE